MQRDKILYNDRKGNHIQFKKLTIEQIYYLTNKEGFIFFQVKNDFWYIVKYIGGYRVEFRSDNSFSYWGNDINGFFLKTRPRKLKRFLNRIENKLKKEVF